MWKIMNMFAGVNMTYVREIVFLGIVHPRYRGFFCSNLMSFFLEQR